MATATLAAGTDKGTATRSMKIVANRKSLLAALNLVAPVASARQHQPILENVLLSASSSECSLMATDANVVAVAKFEAEVDSPGKTLAPAALLRSMVAAMDDELLSIEANGKLHVRGERTQHELATAKVNDFPPVPTIKSTFTTEVSLPCLAAFVKSALPNVDCESSRYAISTVCFDFSPGALAVVGTNGHVLSAAQVKIECDYTAMHLVPDRSAKLIAAIGGDGSARLSVSDNWLSVKHDGGSLLIRLAEGRYPRWRDVIPAGTGQCKATLSPETTIACIRRVCVAPADSVKGPEVSLGISDGTLSLACLVGGTKSESEIPVESTGSLNAKFNWKYLLDVLGSFALLDVDAVEFSSEGDAFPAKLTGGDLSAVVMPMANKD